MEREPAVQIREVCRDCDGSGRHRVAAGAGHVTWSKQVACATCDGTGQAARWIGLSELKQLLEAAPGGDGA